MKEHCVYRGIQKLAMPRIGCCVDRWKWNWIKRLHLITKVFGDTDIQITIYCPSKCKTPKIHAISKVQAVEQNTPSQDSTRTKDCLLRYPSQTSMQWQKKFQYGTRPRPVWDHSSCPWTMCPSPLAWYLLIFSIVSNRTKLRDCMTNKIKRLALSTYMNLMLLYVAGVTTYLQPIKSRAHCNLCRVTRSQPTKTQTWTFH